MVFVSDFQVFAFLPCLSSVIPTPWTHMVLDVLSCYLIWLYWQYLPKDYYYYYYYYIIIIIIIHCISWNYEL